MPAPITVFGVAKAKLISLTQPTVDPVLTTTEGGEIETALNNHAVATLWAANTTYNVNDIVQPTVNNRTGRRYKCVTKGTSHATTEPTWPDSQYSRVSDGTVVWEEAGFERDLWDIYAAAHECWMIKAGKASARYGFSTDGQSFSRNQLYDQCMRMAQIFVPVSVA